MQKRFILLVLIIATAGTLFAKEKKTMIDPAIDNLTKEWCYGGRTTAVIGVPFVTEPIQVTYDGAIYTRYGELAFFYSDKNRPVMIRQRKALEGWIPVIIGEWESSGIEYRLEIFSSTIASEKHLDNLTQYIKFSAKNGAKENQIATIGGFFRGSGEDYRLGQTKQPIKGSNIFKFNKNSFIRNGKILFSYSDGATLESVVGKPYKKSYKAWKLGIKNNRATGIVRYRKALQPNEELTAFFRMDRVPQFGKNRGAVIESEYNNHYSTTVKYWKTLLPSNQFSIPEERVNESWKGAMVNLILATRTQNGVKRQGSGLPYDSLFLNDFVDMRMAYDSYGLDSFVEVNIPWLKNSLLKSGMFMDRSLSHGTELLASHGQALYSMSHHAIMSNNSNYAKEVFPLIKKATEWIISEHHKNPNGLLPPSTPYDNEMIKGCYTSHNLWGVVGLRNSIRVAKMVGEDKLAKSWEREELSYLKSVRDGIDWTFDKSGYITTGLYDYITGEAARSGFAEYRTDQEWENNMLFYPTEVLDRDDPRIKITLDTIRKRKYREGVMTYRNGQHLHQYITINQAHQYMAIGDEKQALTDLYHVLLHNGPTHEGFENLVVPWGNRTPDASCPPPHGWAAAKTALFIRNMMVREEGGKAGLIDSQRGLVLFSLISPAWVQSGKSLVINSAPIEHGVISADLTFTKTGFNLSIEGDYRRAPAFIAIPIPWHKKIISATSRDGEVSITDERIIFKSDIKSLNVVWEDVKGANDSTYQNLLKGYRSEFPFTKDREKYITEEGKMEPFLTEGEVKSDSGVISFDLVKKAWLAEYSRRFKEFVKSGGKVESVEPPKIK